MPTQMKPTQNQEPEIKRPEGAQTAVMVNKSYTTFGVSEDLLSKAVLAVREGEEKARSTGDIQTFEVFRKGHRQNLVIGRIMIVPPAVADKRETFPTILLHGAVCKELNPNDFVDLVTKQIGGSEFDEYSQADMAEIKDRLFKNVEGKLVCLVFFSPAWTVTREQTYFHFTKDEEILSNLVQHLVFGAYYNPALSSAWDMLMSPSDALNVNRIDPKITFPWLALGGERNWPNLEKTAAGLPHKRLFCKRADLKEDLLEGGELAVLDELTKEVKEKVTREITPIEEVAKTAEMDKHQFVPAAHTSKKCEKCNQSKDAPVHKDSEPKTACCGVCGGEGKVTGVACGRCRGITIKASVQKQALHKVDSGNVFTLFEDYGQWYACVNGQFKESKDYPEGLQIDFNQDNIEFISPQNRVDQSFSYEARASRKVMSYAEKTFFPNYLSDKTEAAMEELSLILIRLSHEGLFDGQAEVQQESLDSECEECGGSNGEHLQFCPVAKQHAEERGEDDGVYASKHAAPVCKCGHGRTYHDQKRKVCHGSKDCNCDGTFKKKKEASDNSSITQFLEQNGFKVFEAGGDTTFYHNPAKAGVVAVYGEHSPEPAGSWEYWDATAEQLDDDVNFNYDISVKGNSLEHLQDTLSINEAIGDYADSLGKKQAADIIPSSADEALKNITEEMGAPPLVDTSQSSSKSDGGASHSSDGKITEKTPESETKEDNKEASDDDEENEDSKPGVGAIVDAFEEAGPELLALASKKEKCEKCHKQRPIGPNGLCHECEQEERDNEEEGVDKQAGFGFTLEVPSQVLREFYPELQHEIVDYPNVTNHPMIEDFDLVAALDGALGNKQGFISTSPAAGAGIGRDGKPQVLEGVPLRKEPDIRGYGFSDEFYQQTESVPGSKLVSAGQHIRAALVVDWCPQCYGEEPDMSSCTYCDGEGVDPQGRMVHPDSRSIEQRERENLKSAAAKPEEIQLFKEFLKLVVAEVAASLIAAFKCTQRPLMNMIPGTGQVNLETIELGTGASALSTIQNPTRVRYLLTQLNDGNVRDAINDAYAQAAVWNEDKGSGFTYEVFVRAENIDIDSCTLEYKYIAGTKGT